MALLRTVLVRVEAAGWAVEHVDATVVLERPKLAPAPRRDPRVAGRQRWPRQRQRQVHDRREDGLRRPRGGRRRAGGGHAQPAGGDLSAAEAVPRRASWRRSAAAARRSCSCSTWRLSCCSERRRWPRTVGRGEALGEPARDPRRRRRRRRAGARRVVRPVSAARRRQRPRWSMPVIEIQARSASARELDDLDQAADLGRADAHQHPVARAEPGALARPPTSQRVTPDMKCR